MTNQKPIEPLPSRELVDQWQDEWWDQRERPGSSISELPFIATKAAQWGYKQRGAVNEAELQKARDEELEACCEWLVANDWAVPGGKCLQDLRAARRPKPSLEEQALDLLDRIEHNAMAKNLGNEKAWDIKELEAIRAALIRLRELETNQ